MLATILLAALGLLACGGDDEEQAIERAVERAFTTKDGDLKCERLSTKSFVTRVYGELAQCRRAERADSGDSPPTGATASDVEVDGESATVKIRLTGGDNDGASGTIDVRKQDGAWRVDDLGVDLLRAQVRASLAHADPSEPALRDPKVRGCVRAAFLRLDDAQLRRIGYMAIAETDEGQAQVAKLVTPCLTDSGGRPGDVSALRRLFESGVAESAREDGVSRDSIACINRELRSSISDDEIAKTAVTGGKPTAAMKRGVAEAFGRCQGGEASQGASVLREYFERGVRRGAGKGVPKQTLDCLIRRLRRSISDAEILAAAKDARTKARLTRRAARELLACRASGPQRSS